MFEALDTAIAIGVIYLILSMVNKYFVSMIKRWLNIKAELIAGEMETFIGEKTTTFLIPYLERKAKHLNFLDKTKKGNGFRELNKKQLEKVVKQLDDFLENNDNKEIIEELGIKIDKDKIDDTIKEITDYLQVLKDSIESAYDNTMKKISEAYKKNIRRNTFICGIILAVVINADFFSIYNTITKSAIVRDNFVSIASVTDEEYLKSLSDEQLAEIKTKKDLENSITESGEKYTKMENTLSEAGLVLGWRANEFSGPNVDAQGMCLIIFMKVVGIFISALLISFGAPFWHEFLSSFTGIKDKLKGKKSVNNDDSPPTTPVNVQLDANAGAQPDVPVADQPKQPSGK